MDSNHRCFIVTDLQSAALATRLLSLNSLLILLIKRWAWDSNPEAELTTTWLAIKRNTNYLYNSPYLNCPFGIRTRVCRSQSPVPYRLAKGHWLMDLQGLEPRIDRLWAGCSNQTELKVQIKKKKNSEAAPTSTHFAVSLSWQHGNRLPIQSHSYTHFLFGHALPHIAGAFTLTNIMY